MTGPAVHVGAAPRAAPEVLAAAHRAAFDGEAGQAWSARSFLEMIADPTLCWVEALDADTLLHGFAIFRRVMDEAELLTICRAPCFSRQGLGAILLQAGIDDLKTRGAKTVFLEVSERNLNALSLYRRFGFKEEARRPRYYLRADGGIDDAIVMRNQLTFG